MRVPFLAVLFTSCGSPDVCERYEAEWECMGIPREVCEETFESCTDKDLRLIDDAYGCLFDAGVFGCEQATTRTADFDAMQECGEEMGAVIENVSDECAGYGGGLTTSY